MHKFLRARKNIEADIYRTIEAGEILFGARIEYTDKYLLCDTRERGELEYICGMADVSSGDWEIVGTYDVGSDPQLDDFAGVNSTWGK